MDEVQKRHVTTAEDKYGQLVVYFLRNLKPVQITEEMSDTAIFPDVTDEVHCCIENELQPVQHVTSNTRQGRTAIVESCQYQWHERRQQQWLTDGPPNASQIGSLGRFQFRYENEYVYVWNAMCRLMFYFTSQFPNAAVPHLQQC